jgi:hypothetical protein
MNIKLLSSLEARFMVSGSFVNQSFCDIEKEVLRVDDVGSESDRSSPEGSSSGSTGKRGSRKVVSRGEVRSGVPVRLGEQGLGRQRVILSEGAAESTAIEINSIDGGGAMRSSVGIGGERRVFDDDGAQF